MSFGLAPLGYLAAIRAIVRQGQPEATEPIERDPLWIVPALVVVITFSVTSRGVWEGSRRNLSYFPASSLAASALSSARAALSRLCMA
jgi:hypothetical protein